MAERKITSRSENLREKRENKANRTPARKPRVPQSASQNMPPVLMRGGFTSMASLKQKRKGKNPKRRFDIALSSPGVEIRLPALPSVSLGWRLLSAVMATGLLVLFYHLWTSPLYQVQVAELEGNQFLDNETVNQVINLYQQIPESSLQICFNLLRINQENWLVIKINYLVDFFIIQVLIPL